jgi:hypothetical protein
LIVIDDRPILLGPNFGVHISDPPCICGLRHVTAIQVKDEGGKVGIIFKCLCGLTRLKI